MSDDAAFYATMAYTWPTYRPGLGIPCGAHGRAVCRSCALEAWCFRAIADALFGWIP